MNKRTQWIRRISVLVLTLVFYLGITQSADALEILDPNELFYITGDVSKTEISPADANENGRYELSYEMQTALPELLCKYIPTYSQYVTEFSFRLDVSMTNGLEPDPYTVSLDSTFGEVKNISVAGRMMYMDLVLKTGTSLSDYSYDEWRAPIKLSFDAELAEEAFSPGDRLAVSLDVSGNVAGEHPMLGELYASVHGIMDPNNDVIVTDMKESGAAHTPHQPEAPTYGLPLPNDEDEGQIDEYHSDIIEETPADGQGTPADGQVTPADGQGTPADGQETPADGQGTPADGQGTPADGQGTPADGQGTPSDGQGTPADGQGTPADGQGTPADGQTVWQRMSSWVLAQPKMMLGIAGGVLSAAVILGLILRRKKRDG